MHVALPALGPRVLAALLVALGPLMASCATTLELGAPITTGTFTETGTLRAAAAVVDITPPAGLGLFGHGPESREAVGHRGRLRCRALVLEDAAGGRAALVSCDLAAISAALHREVAAQVQGATGLGIERIVLSATHTHAGPAHYFGDRNYTGSLSSKVTGYDPRVTRFLASRIAGAIVDASGRLVPARAAFVEERVVGPGEGIPALGQNRSLVAHCLNTAPMGASASTCGAALPDAYAEVEGMLSLLYVEALGGDDGAPLRPLALYASYPVHATSVPNTNDLYHADLFGEAARMVEARVANEPAGEGFVAVIANGAEGDVCPDYDAQRFDESLRLGRALGARILDARTRVVALDAPRIAAAFEDLTLAGTESDGAHLCAEPELGRASAGGSEEGRTGFYALPRFREGSRDEGRGGCHGPRAPIAFRRIAAHGFPTRAPLGVVTLGPLTFVAIPGEATTTVGIRLRQRVTAARRGPVILVGLANDYLQYLTTAEEFAAQHYEGASTLYGPGSERVLGARYEALARSIVAGSPLVDVRPLETRTRIHDRLERPRTAHDPQLVHARPRRFEGHAAYVIEVEASDAATLLAQTGPIARVERRSPEGGYVPARDPLGVPIDDLGPYVILRRLSEARDGVTTYRVIFVLPEDAIPGAYRIVFRSAGRELASPPFPYRGER